MADIKRSVIYECYLSSNPSCPLNKNSSIKQCTPRNHESPLCTVCNTGSNVTKHGVTTPGCKYKLHLSLRI